MRIAVFGAGAVGGYFGGRLAESGQEVAFVARGQTLTALKERGLRVDSLKGDFVVHPCTATDRPDELGPVDYVILGVKAWQVGEAAGAVKPLLGESTLVVPLQNGVEAGAQLVRGLGAEHAGAGLCTIIAMQAAPGHIRHVGGEPHIEFAEQDGRRSERVERLRGAFETTGVSVAVPDDIEVALWRKFVMITSFAGLGAVTRAPIGVIRTVPEARRLLEDVLAEIVTVARARNVDLPERAAQAALDTLRRFEPASTASMQRDIAEGNPSELDFLTGAVVRLGREAGVETPANELIYRSLLPSELRARGEIEWPG